MTTTTYIVGVYEISREWPSPEEDGKWYKIGKLVRASRIFRNETSAYDFVYRMNRTLQYRIKRYHADPIYHLNNNIRLFHAKVFKNELPKLTSSKKKSKALFTIYSFD